MATSSLTAQNDLFEHALARKRVGDVPGAIAGFEDLVAKYPSSYLAQSARAERMKLLQAIDHDRARTAAREYLLHYPNGFAKSDAERILASPHLL